MFYTEKIIILWGWTFDCLIILIETEKDLSCDLYILQIYFIYTHHPKSPVFGWENGKSLALVSPQESKRCQISPTRPSLGPQPITSVCIGRI